MRPWHFTLTKNHWTLRSSFPNIAQIKVSVTMSWQMSFQMLFPPEGLSTDLTIVRFLSSMDSIMDFKSWPRDTDMLHTSHDTGALGPLKLLVAMLCCLHGAVDTETNAMTIYFEFCCFEYLLIIFCPKMFYAHHHAFKCRLTNNL